MSEDQFDLEITSAVLPELAGKGQPLLSTHPTAHRPWGPCLCWPGYRVCSVWVSKIRPAQNHPNIWAWRLSLASASIYTRFKTRWPFAVHRWHLSFSCCTIQPHCFWQNQTTHTSFLHCHLQWLFTSLHTDGQVFTGSWQMPISPPIRQLFRDFKEKWICTWVT